MQNELSFGVEFTREQIQLILADTTVTRIVVSGTYSYIGGGVRDMNATGQGISTNHTLVGPSQTACIQPCPTG